MSSDDFFTIAVPRKLRDLLAEIALEEKQRQGTKPSYAMIIWRWAEIAGAVKTP